ncbi:MAG: SUMF1/EgtB/PvdO family nonheme iron enzyme, partial [Gammaproteobacteria bacterium]
MNAKHVMVVADSCYAGSLLTRDSESRLPTGEDHMIWLQRMAKLKARTALTSGGLEPVLDRGGGDHSVFAKAFLDALRENDDILDGNGLFNKVKHFVVKKSKQVPRYADVTSPKHDGGDFLLVPKPLQMTLTITEQAVLPDTLFRGKQIDDMLLECQAHYDANRLTTGRGGNAADCYEEVLQQDRGNREALDGLSAIKNRYRDWAEKALKQGRFDRAESYIAKIELFNPEGETVFELKEQLLKAQNRHDPVAKTKPVAPKSRPSQQLVGEMIPIKAGCFQMGSPKDEKYRKVVERLHEVCVEDFKLGKFEVTQAQWQAVMGKNPSYVQECTDCPVEQVSWRQVRDYLEKLYSRTGQRYRLPTEAEWEYACRGGRLGERYCGGNDIDAVAWYYPNRGEKTHPVGTKQANAFGVYDMSGNVTEWTCSTYDKVYSGGEKLCADENDDGARVLRGGSWIDKPSNVRAAKRNSGGRDHQSKFVGFRLAQD